MSPIETGTRTGSAPIASSANASGRRCTSHASPSTASSPATPAATPSSAGPSVTSTSPPASPARARPPTGATSTASARRRGSGSERRDRCPGGDQHRGALNGRRDGQQVQRHGGQGPPATASVAGPLAIVAPAHGHRIGARGPRRRHEPWPPAAATPLAAVVTAVARPRDPARGRLRAPFVNYDAMYALARRATPGGSRPSTTAAFAPTPHPLATVLSFAGPAARPRRGPGRLGRCC